MKNGTLAKPATFDDHAFAMPSDPPSGKLSSRYDVYDANHQRYQQVYTNGSLTETTMYVGGLLEKVTISSLVDYRHYIKVGSCDAGGSVIDWVMRTHKVSFRPCWSVVWARCTPPTG